MRGRALDGKGWLTIGLTVASFIPGPIGAVASVGLAVMEVASGNLLGAGLALLGPLGKTLSWGYRTAKLMSKFTSPVVRGSSRTWRGAAYATRTGWGRTKKIAETFGKTKNMSPRMSFAYHYGKHGTRYKSAHAYLEGAKKFANSKGNVSGKFRGSPGGTMINGKLVTFR